MVKEKSLDFNSEDRWQVDQTIMSWWDATNDDERKHVELDCYKLFKASGFNDEFIPYLRENDADKLADEMEHFLTIYQKVPHEHEKRKAA